MCGLAGFVDFGGGHCDGIAEAMVDSLRHRGPDDAGIIRTDVATLVHTRLSILDVSRSVQPMRVGQKIFVFNGEVYNFRSIRDRLVPPIGGWKTDGDTEVLLALLEQRGTEALDDVDGMFAFALWDDDQRILLLGRDRFGKKPLFVARPRPDLIVFGSEPKALLLHPNVVADLDTSVLRSVVLSRACYGQQSLFSAVSAVRPGTCLRWSGGEARIERYFSPSSLFEEPKSVESLENVLRNAVRNRLVSDVPVGAFLSGGIDSSIIVALMRQEMEAGQPLHTFSVSFVGDSYDEHPHASAVAARFGAIHERVAVGPDRFIEEMARLSFLRDAPLSEPADVALAILSKRARQDVKVVLSGEGADEAFGGYPKYLLARTPSFVRSVMQLVGPKRIPRLARAMGISQRRATIAVDALTEPGEVERLRRWFAVANPIMIRRVFPRLWKSDVTGSLDDPFAESLAELSGLDCDPIQRMQYVDLSTWLPGNLLERGDRMTMAEGLEARMPFMNRSVIQYGLTLEPSTKVRGRLTKRPLRTLCENLVGSDIARRRKWGFRVPLDAWFRGPLREMLLDAVSSKNSFTSEYGDAGEIEKIVTEHQQFEIDHQNLLWSILIIEMWYQNRFAGTRITAMEPSTPPETKF